MPIANVTRIARHAAGPLSTVKEHEISLTPDSAYPTGGSVDFSVGFFAAMAAGPFDEAVSGRILDVEIIRNSQGYSVEYDEANDKLLAYVPAGTEVPNTTDLAAAIGGDWTLLVRMVSE